MDSQAAVVDHLRRQIGSLQERISELEPSKQRDELEVAIDGLQHLTESLLLMRDAATPPSKTSV